MWSNLVLNVGEECYQFLLNITHKLHITYLLRSKSSGWSVREHIWNRFVFHVRHLAAFDDEFQANCMLKIEHEEWYPADEKDGCKLHFNGFIFLWFCYIICKIKQISKLELRLGANVATSAMYFYLETFSTVY